MKKFTVFAIWAVMLLLSVPTMAEETDTHSHCYCGGYIENEGHSSHTVAKFTPWDGESAISYNSKNAAFVYLTNDVTRNTTLTVPGGKTLTLCLNSHSITMQGSDRVININSNGRLRLCDCPRSSTAEIRGGKNQHGAGIHIGGTLEMFGGIITGNQGTYGGGVYNNRNFYLYGGDVYNNKANYGGGVWNNNDSTTDFIMYGGSIHSNSASCGGGVWCNDNSSFIIIDGAIMQNVTGTAGGGVWINNAFMEIRKGLIYKNTSKWGGGIWNNGGTLLIKGGNISHNTATNDTENAPDGRGGGIWNNDDGFINMSGGEITFNKALAGGGVWCNDGSEFVMSSGVMAENEAEIGAGIYIQHSENSARPGIFRLRGNAGIVYNYAGSVGGGAYIKGILYTSDDGEITANTAGDETYADIAGDASAQINTNVTMPTQFVDVPEGSYFLEPVKWALEKGITTGTTDVTFSPDDKCSRGQVITFLYRMHGSPETNGFYYADTSPSDYFYDATRWAWELEMEKANAFSPNSYCTRSSAIKYMWIAAGKPDSSTPLPFNDVPEDSNYAKAVAWALENGITTGTTRTTFSPNAKCTRAQIVTLLYRAFNK